MKREDDTIAADGFDYAYGSTRSGATSSFGGFGGGAMGLGGGVGGVGTAGRPSEDSRSWTNVSRRVNPSGSIGVPRTQYGGGTGIVVSTTKRKYATTVDGQQTQQQQQQQQQYPNTQVNNMPIVDGGYGGGYGGGVGGGGGGVGFDEPDNVQTQLVEQPSQEQAPAEEEPLLDDFNYGTDLSSDDLLTETSDDKQQAANTEENKEEKPEDKKEQTADVKSETKPEQSNAEAEKAKAAAAEQPLLGADGKSESAFKDDANVGKKKGVMSSLNITGTDVAILAGVVIVALIAKSIISK